MTERKWLHGFSTPFTNAWWLFLYFLQNSRTRAHAQITWGAAKQHEKIETGEISKQAKLSVTFSPGGRDQLISGPDSLHPKPHFYFTFFQLIIQLILFFHSDVGVFYPSTPCLNHLADNERDMWGCTDLLSTVKQRRSTPRTEYRWDTRGSSHCGEGTIPF